MTDRELLEKAAKAAGLAVIIPAAHQRGLWIKGLEDEWNPLTDDGDALRLAVKLSLQVTPGTYNSEEATAYKSAHAEAHERVHFLQDIGAATRRAIVRAAAEIGKGMRPFPTAEEIRDEWT